MKYSDKLNGYWEEGYHYYIEIRDNKMTVHDYRRAVALETEISYDCDALEKGERTVITLSDNILSYTAAGEMMTEIKELAYSGGELQLLYYYTIMGETNYTLKKVKHGPFDHIIIRDEEFLDTLQGKWKQWTPNGDGDYMIISGNTLSWLGGGKFHAVSYNYGHNDDYDKGKVYLVPENLIDDNFSGFTKVEVKPDMLITTMIVMDMNMPLSVFAREDMLSKIEIPDGAKAAPRNTMMYHPEPTVDTPLMSGVMGMGMYKAAGGSNPLVTEPEKPTGKGHKFCSNCGYKLEDENGKFCPNCGLKL